MSIFKQRIFKQDIFKHSTKLFFLLLFLVFLFSSCEDCTFTSKNATLIRLRFYPQGGTKAARFLIDSVRTERGNIYRRATATGIDTLSLPINPTNVNGGYYVFFRTIGSRPQRDTLNITYDRLFSVVSPICGYDQQISNLLVVPQRTTLRSEVFKSSLTVGDSVNIRIFF
jgi:hypothetical protein